MGREQAEKLWDSLLGLGTRRLIALAFVGLAVMGIVGVGGYILSRPQQEVLYSGLSRDDVARIGTALRDVGIDFDVNADGETVFVRYGDTARARMLLAEKGLPQNADAGYEIFNQIGAFGLTSFMQGVTKTRALEGELSRSIQSLSGIHSARVHLVLPDPGSFRSDRQPGSASVVIATEMPTDATPAEAIRHLVAAAVPGLSIDNVTVLNTAGTVLASGDDMESASGGRMALVTQTVAQDIEAKIRRTLTPYLGVDNFQVSVVPLLNMDRRTISETIFDPKSRVERSVRTIRENALALDSVTDTPASVQTGLPEQAGAQGPAESGRNSNETKERREELTNYEVSTKTIETASEGFEIEQLSIAVLVNKVRLAAAANDATDPTPVEHQLMDIEQLVASASGFNAPRGDQLKVAAVAFVDSAPEALPEPGLMASVVEQFGSVINAVALIVVALIAVFLGLRPAINTILTQQVPAAPAQPALPRNEEGAAAAPPPAANAPGDANLIEDVTRNLEQAPHKRLEQIVELDEEQAAAILRQWLRQDEAA